MGDIMINSIRKASILGLLLVSVGLCHISTAEIPAKCLGGDGHPSSRSADDISWCQEQIKNHYLEMRLELEAIYEKQIRDHEDGCEERNVHKKASEIREICVEAAAYQSVFERVPSK